MTGSREINAGGAARGELRLPPSKSLTNRHLTLALLARRAVLLERPLLAEDTCRYLEALRQLGLSVSGTPRLITLGASVVPPRGGRLWCGASGTMLRFLTAALTTVPGEWVVDGTERLRRRPLAGLLAALRGLGAEIEALARPDFAPLKVHGGTLRGGRISVDARESSQFVSALMLSATSAAGPVTLDIAGLVSAPYVDLTCQALERWGATAVRGAGGTVRVNPARLEGGRFALEGDDSSACYFAAGAALIGGRMRLLGLSPDSTHGDRAFLEVLRGMGLSYEWWGDALEVAGDGRLEAVDVDMSDLPDQVPTLAVLAPFAKGTTRIRNVAHVRLKESDRLASVTAGLRAAGAEVTEGGAGLSIPGIWAEGDPPREQVVVDSFDDHRIAMSFAVLGLRRPGVVIADPLVVAKSYPSFWTDFGRCLEADRA